MRLADSIITAVAGYYGLPEDAIRGKSRLQSLVHARHVAMYLITLRTDMSLKEIGMEFDGRDHSTVIDAKKSVLDNIDTYPRLEAEIEDVSARIRPVAWNTQAVPTPGMYAAARERAASFGATA